MKKKELGSTGISISRFGFGGMPLSISGRPDEPTAKKTLHAAIDAGFDLIDTADVYCLDNDDLGHNERLIASVLAERDDAASVRVATKGGLLRPKGDWTNDASPKRLRQACEASLRALRTDRIFLYQLHAPDPQVPFEKSVETLARLKDEEKIEHVGLSNVSVRQIRSALDIVPIVTVQNRLNVYFREAISGGVVDECDQRKITFLAYSPVGGGRLAKKLPSFPLLQELAKKNSCSTHAIALVWVRERGTSVVPIPAARSIDHVLDSAAAADLEISAEDLASVTEAEFSRA